MLEKSTALVTLGLFSFGLVSSANAALETRLGGLAYYDTVLDITWAADGKINGNMNWDDANTWAEGLTIDGITGWRLPSADVDGDGIVVNCIGGGVIGCADNEMGFLFWEEEITASNPDPLTNIQSLSTYWSGTDLFGLGVAYANRLDSGSQGLFDTGLNLLALAVHDGDVGAVPVPIAVWLFGSALGMLGCMRRKAH